MTTIHCANLSHGYDFHLQFLTFIGNYVVTVFVSVVATLAFESPIIIIEKLIFAPKRDDEPINSRDIRQHQADISYEQLENMHD